MTRLSRRSVVLRLAGGALLGTLAACSAPAAAPTTAPKPTQPVAAAPPTSAAKPVEQPTAKPAPTSAAKPAPTAAPKTIRKWQDVQTGPQLYNAFLMTANRKGLDKPLGIDLNIELLAPANLLKVVFAGERDSAIVAFSSLPNAIEQGADAKGVLSIFHKVPHRLVVRKEVNSLRDLYGQTFTIPAPNTLSDALIKAAMKQEGLDPEQLKFVAIGGAEAARAAAFVAGQIDAGTVPPEYLPTVLSNPDYKVLFAFGDRLPQYVRQVHFVTNKQIKEHREDVQAYVTALLQGTRYAIEHKAETLAIGAEMTGEKIENLAPAFDDYVQNKLINPDGNISPEAVKFMQEINIAAGDQQQILPYEQVWDPSFTEAAVKQLGKYQWKS